VDTERDEQEALRCRDEAAWAALHREHFPRIWNSVNRILNHPALSDDVVQETFIKAYREIDRFAGQSRIGTWLYRIAINQALDTVRKQQRRERWVSLWSGRPSEEDETSPMPEPLVPAESSRGLERADLRREIEQAMAELTPDHRAVVQLRLIEERSLVETASLLRCKEGTVNSRLHYACEYLKKKLSKGSEHG
jgi:RNA polymerase sigma-70 factor, ECF subfamily